MEADDLLGRSARDSADGSAEVAANERAIADRLDALEAERVFARALELESEQLDQPHLFSADQIESIADEINMDVTFVRQALGEIRLTPKERSWIERRILPDHIMEAETIEGLSRDEVDELIDKWMRTYEGLIEASTVDGGVQWDVDRRLTRRLKTSQVSGGNRISRVAGGDVTHRVHSLSDEEHVVAMQSEGEGPLLLGKAGLAVGALIILMGAVGGLSQPLAEYLQTLASLAVVGGGVAAGAVWTARRWAKGIGRALKRSLTGLLTQVRPKWRRNEDKPSFRPVANELLNLLSDQLRKRRESRDNRRF